MQLLQAKQKIVKHLSMWRPGLDDEIFLATCLAALEKEINCELHVIRCTSSCNLQWFKKICAIAAEGKTELYFVQRSKPKKVARQQTDNYLLLRLKFLYRKQKLLTLPLRRLQCNYACSAWYPSLNKKTVKDDSNIPE